MANACFGKTGFPGSISVCACGQSQTRGSHSSQCTHVRAAFREPRMLAAMALLKSWPLGSLLSFSTCQESSNAHCGVYREEECGYSILVDEVFL